jgi:RNA polymerase I-specific transcription initiation factor RRN7
MLVLISDEQVDHVPKSWRERLPAWAQKMLLTRYATFRGGELHRAVMTLMLGYKRNRGLVFPAPPVPSLLLAYLRDLALPRTYLLLSVEDAT